MVAARGGGARRAEMGAVPRERPRRAELGAGPRERPQRRSRRRRLDWSVVVATTAAAAAAAAAIRRGAGRGPTGAGRAARAGAARESGGPVACAFGPGFWSRVIRGGGLDWAGKAPLAGGLGPRRTKSLDGGAAVRAGSARAG